MNTPNRPRSGIVPPLVTATTRASRRPSTMSVTRSQTTPRLELGELVGRVGAGEHAQDALEHLAGQRLVRRRPRDRARAGRRPVQRSITVIATSCWARTSSGLRGISVASIAPSCIRRVTTAHFEQVAAVLREDHALARRPDLVTGTADALEAAGDARRALDLDDEVDGAHVDARARG